MNTKEEYITTVLTKLEKWSTEISKLKTKTDHSHDGAAPQTIATSREHSLDELQSRTNTNPISPQTIATSKEHNLDEIKSSGDEKIAPQTIATFERRIGTLQSMHESITQKLNALRNADDNSCENLKSDIEDTLNTLGIEIQSLSAKL